MSHRPRHRAVRAAALSAAFVLLGSVSAFANTFNTEIRDARSYAPSDPISGDSLAAVGASPEWVEGNLVAGLDATAAQIVNTPFTWLIVADVASDPNPDPTDINVLDPAGRKYDPCRPLTSLNATEKALQTPNPAGYAAAVTAAYDAVQYPQHCNWASIKVAGPSVTERASIPAVAPTLLGDRAQWPRCRTAST